MSSEQIAFSWMLLWRLKRTWWKVLLSVLLLCTAFCFPVATKNYFGMLHKKETLLTQPANYSELLNHSKHKFDILYSPMSQKVEGIMTEFRAIFPNTLINSISGLQNEHEVHKLFSWKYKTNENANKGFGVIFTDVDNKTLHYTLRSTDSDLWLTNKKFSHLMFPGPCSSGKMYFTEGFIGVQIGINLGYMKYYKKPINEWYIQEFPYPAHVENKHLEFINFYIVTIAFSIGMIPISIWLIFSVFNEKNKGANGLIKSKGGKSWMISGTVFIFFYSQVVVAVTISCVVMFIHFRNGPVFSHSIPLVVWSFFMSYGSVSLCYAYFCTALFNKTTYALLFFTICKSIPLSVFIIFKSKIIFLEYMLIMIPDFALLQGNKLATIYEASGVGLRLANIFEFIPGLEISFVSIIFVMLVVGFVLSLLTLYLSEIMPGQFEVPKPWHFIIPEKVKTLLIKDKIDISLLVMDLPTNYHVEEATSFSVGIQLYNITKVYGVFKAVNSITMNIYKDQITAVLGHNGAGKTTLMNILTGMTLPNSGFVVVDGVNVNLWKTEYRKKFSYCPQKNLVLHSLSVKEQIIFFGIVSPFNRKEKKIQSTLLQIYALRKVVMSGLSKDVAEANGSQLMEKLDLAKQKNLLPNRLPEGVRRKLALANALISNPRILYLDEPTTGLDPKSRRQIWDILISFKGEKTIIITTHIMEEADVLGDRIAIMAHGELRCYGAGHMISVYYLRRKYHRKIVQLLKQYSDVTIIENKDFKQISFNIPLETTSKLSGILRRIENSKQFKITRIGISSTSLEDIFVRISKNEGLTSIVERSDFDKMCHKQTTIGKSAKCWQQYYALFYKKLRHLRSNWVLMIVMLYLIPGIYSLFCMTIVKIYFGYHFTVNPFILSLENYEQSNVLARLDKHNYTEDSFLHTMKQSTDVQITTNDIVTELLKAAKYDETKYRSSMIIAADFLENFTVFYSSFAIHAPAIAVNVLFNVLTNSSIQAINYPYPFHLESCDPSSSQGLQLATIWICFGICLAICLSYFCIYTLVERKTGVKHLQYMMGITPLTYWSFQLLFDFMKFSITVFLFVLAVYLYNEGIFQTFNFLSVLIIALFLFGTCMILLCYASSFFFKNYSLAQIWVSGVVLLFAPGPVVMDWLTNYNSVAHYLFHFSPLTAFLEVIWQTMKIARLKTICSICSTESLRDVCKEVKEPPLLTFNIKTLIIWLIVDCILYFCLLMLLDSHYLRAFVSRKQGFKLESVTSMDSDVMFERQKVEGKMPIQTKRKTSTPDQKENMASLEHFAKFNAFDDKKSPKGGVKSDLAHENIMKQTSPELLKVDIEKNLGLANFKKTSPESLKNNDPSLNPTVTSNNAIESNLGLSNFKKQTPPEVVKNKHPSLTPTDILNDTIEGNSLTTNQQPLKIIQEKERSTSINTFNNMGKESNNLGLVRSNTQTFMDVPKVNWLMRDSLDLQYIAKENNLGIASPVNPIPDVMIDKWPSLKPTIISNKLTTEKLASTTNDPSANAHDNRKQSGTKTGETNTGTSKSNVEQITGTQPSEDLVTSSDPSRMLHNTIKVSPNPSKSSHGSHSSNLEKPLVMVVDNLGKKYSAQTTAVYDVSFTCLKGDCLGIVGPHGAGKSTLFMMITGLITPTKGDVRLYLASRSLSISENRREFLSYLGYCPQIDSLSIELTGREILKFFALLRGIPIREVEQVTNAWIKNLDLQLYGDKLCGQYSNGNKRKLCTALSLIGNPYVVLLDEPTSGIDTVTKKKLWVLFKYFQSLDETLVLNTHSMEECEVICNKITVMINGTLKCIGSMQHLKNKYTHGFTLYIKINNIQTSIKLPFLKSSLTNVFKENCQLKYEGEGFLHYHVNNDNLKCYELFEKMESIKSSCDLIDEYTISDTNLEKVFIDLANEGDK
ncbi:ATP-binding cassette sub-family A member 3-like isoform X3 [Cimex lectularius]|uniref:ABC transporter domain-containing protein n=1 Tax=Cimex lectularius TaxID=79782 RepID=A0A8I6TI70_CIMLE|nr:ATP-binding cassette sub-family A member 3-like isoform X3 [Cimex lectularius]